MPGDADIVGIRAGEDIAVVLGRVAHDRDLDVRYDDRPAPGRHVGQAHGPDASGTLASECLGLERPPAIERPVAGPRDQRARRARRRGDRGGQVLHTARLDVDRDQHALDQVVRADRAADLQRNAGAAR